MGEGGSGFQIGWPGGASLEVDSSSHDSEVRVQLTPGEVTPGAGGSWTVPAPFATINTTGLYHSVAATVYTTEWSRERDAGSWGRHTAVGVWGPRSSRRDGELRACEREGRPAPPPPSVPPAGSRTIFRPKGQRHGLSPKQQEPKLGLAWVAPEATQRSQDRCSVLRDGVTAQQMLAVALGTNLCCPR